LFVNSIGQVGVGKVPVQLFDAEAAGNAQVRVTTTDTSGGNIGSFVGRYTGGGGGTASTVVLRAGDGYTSVGASTNSPLVFINNETERMRLDTSGRLGLGTSSPNWLLQVAGNAAVIQEDSFLGVDATTSPRLGIVKKSGASPVFAAGSATAITFSHSSASDITGVSSNTYTPRLTIDSSGRVGIGTTSPGATLDVNGKLRLSSTEDNQLEWVTGAQTWRSNVVSGGKWYLYDVTNAKFPLDVSANSTCKLDINTSHVAFTTNASERARIDSSGRLLVGTSTAQATNGGSLTRFQIQGTDAETAGQSVIRHSNSAGGPWINLGKSRGTAAGGITIVQDNDPLGTIGFFGADGTDINTAGATIACAVDGTPGADDMPGRLVLSTTADGASSPTEALRITNDRVIAYNQGAPAAVNATATLTVANLKTGIITSTSAAATDMTLPTGTLTEGGFSGVYTNMTFEWSVINTGPSLVRVLAGTDHTIVGSGSVATGTSGRFASRRTAANTFVAYRLS
jgi:hypothetical protein